MNADDVHRMMKRALAKRDTAIAGLFAGLMWCIGKS